MSTLEALIDQVAGILNRHQIPYSTNESGEEYGVSQGSAAVFITFNEAIGAPTISLSSPVLVDVDLKDDNFAKAHMLMNDLNCNNYLAKFCLYRDEAGEIGVVRLEYDLLGSQLQAEELVAALAQIAGMADHFDDPLREGLGGKPFEAKMEELQSVDT
jgi:hypothetical protein